MAVTLKNIKFYNPYSLPTRPSKRTSPNHNHTSIPHHTSKSTDPTPNHSTLPFSPFSQLALPHPLPPRPPATFPSSHHTASATLYVPSSISHTPDPRPVCKNDFDRALDDFLPAGEKEEDREPSSRLPIQDQRNENHTHTPLSDPEILTEMTVSLLSSSCTLRNPVTSLAEAKSTHPKPRHESQPPEQPNDLACTTCTTSMDTPPAFCTSESHTSAPHEPNHDSTHTTIQASTQDSSVPNQKPVSVHSPESGGAILGNESMDSQGSSGESERPLGDFSKRKRSTSAHLSCPPTPLVIVPDLSRSALMCKMSSWQKSNRSQYSERMVEDPHESGSAPSDDENDADYVDHSETEAASESLHPSKRRRRSPGDASSASQGEPKKSSSESPLADQPESPQENSSPESESIPIRGYLRLRTKGSEVIYTLEFSQTHISSLFTGEQIESPRSHQRAAYSATKTPYSPEEDAYIIDLKAKNLTWDEIEDQFAERFPYRKKTSLQVRYCTKLNPLTKESRKRRIKSCR
ncbi:hypothetical protein EYB26_003644 [Talaromyces marneffei]|uniref:uncharacterized protein n=1 Tax=Talaromyces marneffei TaxID=37727 RepID=UPI0012AA6B86|nr:uncharacterized protein EYB26_003644 [Talaromyces marneffei]QGA15977.1 hypothetical protein EYB26_003644 [Talaromyces marneffei]